MTARQYSATFSPNNQDLALDSPAAELLLPVHTHNSYRPHNRPLSITLLKSVVLRRVRNHQKTILAFFILAVLGFVFHVRLGTFRRDLIYLLRPLWEYGEPSWEIITHYPAPLSSISGDLDIDSWCRLHDWSTRDHRPEIVDAVLFSSELDMLEIRMREYLPYVTTFVVVEADRTFSGDLKPTVFSDNRDRFDSLLDGSGAKIIYHKVTGLSKNLEKGSFDNERLMRNTVGEILTALDIPIGSLIIQSDVDEIISGPTLDLLSSCYGYESTLHLNVDNYRYGFNFPVPDGGYWRPHILTTDNTTVGYHHGRGSNTLLPGSGWHCSFCFPTLEEMRRKMLGYSHNDRVRDPSILEEVSLRERVCKGEDPFQMWPKAHTFKDLITQSGSIKPSHSFTNVPVALQQEPTRFGYLLNDGCDRPDK